MKPIVIYLVLLFAGSGCHSQNIKYIYIKDITSETEKYARDFEDVSNNVNKNFTHLKNKHIDGPLLQKKYMELVKDCRTNYQYGDVLLRYFAELRNGHSGAIFRKYYKNCSASLVEDRVFLSYVGDSIFLRNGIKEKDEITKVNGIPVSAYIREQAKYIPASTDLHRMYLTVNFLFSAYFEEDRVYTISTSAGEKNITVHFEETPQVSNVAKTVSKIESRLLNDSTAYISILSMEGNVVDSFVAAYEGLSAKPYMIIDVRRNQGGNSGNSEKIAAYLVSSERRASVSKRMISPKSNYYTGKLFVLTSPYTFSAAESFVLDLLESGDATLVGMPTGGDTGNQPKFYSSELGYSYWFPSRNNPQVSEKGFPMEGESIKPHHFVQRTVADYMKGKDTILELAMSLISKTDGKQISF